MAKSPLYDDVLARLSLPLALRANVTANGTTVDKADPAGGYDGFTTVLLVAIAGTITDGTHTVIVQDSDDNSAWGAAAAGDVRGTAVFTSASSNSIAEIGYDGPKRYVRASVTGAGATTGGTVGAVAILGGETSKPVKRS